MESGISMLYKRGGSPGSYSGNKKIEGWGANEYRNRYSDKEIQKDSRGKERNHVKQKGWRADEYLNRYSEKEIQEDYRGKERHVKQMEVSSYSPPLSPHASQSSDDGEDDDLLRGYSKHLNMNKMMKG